MLVHYSAYEVIAVINTLSYSLSGCAKLRSVGVRVTCIEWTIFDILNEACAYHFIESSQRTARSDKPEWFFIYLYETLEANLMQLEDLDRAKVVIICVNNRKMMNSSQPRTNLPCCCTSCTASTTYKKYTMRCICRESDDQ